MKKRKLEEAEAEETHSISKRRNQPTKQAADESFTPDSDAAEEVEDEEDEEEEDLKEKKKNKTKSRTEVIKSK